jgi:multidrug resistance efflux pump
VAEAALQHAIAQEAGAEQVWQQMSVAAEKPQELQVAIQDLQAQVRMGQKNIELAEVGQKSARIQEEDAARDQSAVGKILYQIAQKQRQAADVDVQLAQANVQALRTQLRHLNDQYDDPIALQVQARQAEDAYHLAGAAVSLAEAQLQAAKIGPRPEDIAVAQAQVQVAESARALLENQVAQLTLTAPADGLITTRTVEPGEIALPGAILFSLGDLDQVTLRVFIPETKIGKVQLGQTAVVTVDSLDQYFEGVVTYIASDAEFTPQNVQMPEERVNLVFAVEINLENPDHLLKPGMPADAEILTAESNR